MSIIQGHAKGGLAPFYPKTLNGSLRFNSADAPYISYTNTTATNGKKCTLSFWIKKNEIIGSTTTARFIQAYSGVGNQFHSQWGDGATSPGDQWNVSPGEQSSNQGLRMTDAALRDPSAWYHCVWKYNSESGSEESTLYVNGVQQSSSAYTTAPTTNLVTSLTKSGTQVKIGYINSSMPDFQLAELFILDGQSLGADSFGETKNGVWVPKNVTGSDFEMGNNGVYLDFANSADIGNDVSGNANDWTPNNFTASDVVLDSPTDNYATLNPLNKGANTTLANGNLQSTASGHSTALTTFGITSGKWYMEYTVTVDGVGGFGVTTNQAAENGYSEIAGKWWVYDNNAVFGIINQTSASGYSPRFSAGDIVQCAIDYDNGKVFFGVNNVWINSTNGTDGNPSTGANPTFTISTSSTLFPFVENGGGPTYTANFGQQPFEYTPPTNYLALSTSNLPDPVIDPAQDMEPRDYFETFLYTGNGTGLQVGDVIKKPADTTTISNSLIFDNLGYLTFTPSATVSTWTISFWIKLSGTDNDYQYIFSSNPGASGLAYDNRTAGNTNQFYAYAGSVDAFTPKYKDTSRWYHIVFSVTGGTGSFYVDGILVDTTTQVGSWSTGGMRIGAWSSTNGPLSGYLAEFHGIDGTAYAASDFGNFDANGIWIPKEVTGITYGTNGFYLDFSDNTSTTTLGEDQSGKGNDWTATNFATTDQVADSPTNNCVLHLNPSTATTHTISEGNLKTTNTSGTHGGAVCNRAYFSGKWYHEVKILAETSDKGQGVGIGNRVTRNTTEWGSYTNIVAYMSDGTVHTAGGYSAFGNAHNTNDIIGVAYDHDARTLEFFHNGTSQGTLTESDFQSTIDWDNIAPLVFGRNVTQELNFGQRTFYGTDGAGTLPTGYLALSEDNITVDDQNLESPDFVWIKNRSAADSHQLYDSVRGVQKVLLSDPDTNPAEADAPNGLLNFNKNGFTIGSQNEVNTSGEDYVAWCWKAGGTAVSNTDGSITSTVSANTTSGFSIVSYEGNTTTGATVGHGLSSAPEVILVKGRDGTTSWVWNSSVSSLSYGTNYLLLNTTAAVAPATNQVTAADSSVFTLGNGAGSNENSMIAYCFHSVEGFSKFGSYGGNSSNDGVFIYTGFKPAFVMTKISDGGTGGWIIQDTTRSTTNEMDDYLLADTSDNEGTGVAIDFLSNGFKWRAASTNTAFNHNISGDTYIYMAFAETPFKYATAR